MGTSTRLRSRLQEAGLTAGWWLGPRLRPAVRRALERVGGPVANRTGLADTAGWARNVEAIRGVAPTGAERDAAVGSYVRYWLEMLSLPAWTPSDIARGVVIEPSAYDALCQQLATRGAVLALGHLANWDLAGAWAAQHGMGVSTVAEQLGSGQFDDFIGYRTGLGFRVYGHRDPGVVAALSDDARAGRLVCLLADRDFTRHGVEVTWPTAGGGRRVRVPAGPALVAQRSGAALQALALRYDGRQMIMDFSGEIPVGPGAAGVAAACQGVADHLGAAVLARPVDWHVLQPFFGRAAR